jgi:hypothetical protein
MQSYSDIQGDYDCQLMSLITLTLAHTATPQLLVAPVARTLSSTFDPVIRERFHFAAVCVHAGSGRSSILTISDPAGFWVKRRILSSRLLVFNDTPNGSDGGYSMSGPLNVAATHN